MNSPEKKYFVRRPRRRDSVRDFSKRRRQISLLAALCAGYLLANQACVSVKAPSTYGEAGLFSWNAEIVNKTDGKIFSFMKRDGLNVLYQNFSSKNSRREQMAVFLEKAMQEDIKVYQLTGDPSWGTDPEGEKLCEAVETAAAYNRRTQRKFREWSQAEGKERDAVPRLAGVVLDVEPYTLKEWDRDPDGTMKSFVSGMKKAYALAQQYDLELIVCIPWYYDKKEQQEQLEELIKNGCDSIAVMNYYRGAEIKNIATEVKLASKYGKGLITIYEFKRADGQGIMEINTYYNSGLEAARKNYEQLRAAYPELTIPVAFHDYQALEEVLNK